MFDEVQLLEDLLRSELAQLIAYLYDQTSLRIILTGSEIGLLYDFIGFDNPESPLYGRFYKEISLSKFSYEKSRDFLLRGFKQIGVKIDDEILDYAYNKLDGIVGWLVNFGSMCRDYKKAEKKFVDEIFERAIKLVAGELRKFFQQFSEREKTIMKSILRSVASGERSIDEIVRYLKSKEKILAHPKEVSKCLEMLEKRGYIKKQRTDWTIVYKVSDPITSHVSLQENL